MNYEEWMAGVPKDLTDDPIWQVQVYRLAIFLGDIAWVDTSKLVKQKSLVRLSDQLFRAVGSIGANIAEGFSRRSGKDQARYYEYALGSARETRVWYNQARHVLSESVVSHRQELLSHIIRLLLTMIPDRRGYKIQEEQVDYQIPDLPEILTQIPLP